MTAPITEGSSAPDFILPTGDGGTVALSSLKGKPVVVYFYPKDDTTGCTKEAISFSCLKPDFDALGVTVIGISPDDEKSHAKFAKKHDLAITLAADTERKAIDAYGLWVEKSMYGRKYMGVDRSTFLIGRDGKVARAWRNVSVPGHVEEVLAAAKEI